MNFRNCALSVGIFVFILFLCLRVRAQEATEKVTVADIERSYLVRLPRGYDHDRKYPVVVLFHGMNQDPSDMSRLTRFDELADKEGVIAVYPAAQHGRWNIGVNPEVPRVAGPYRRRRGYPGGGYPGGGYPGGGYPGGGYPRRRPPDQRPGGNQTPTTPADDVEFTNHMLDAIATKYSVDPTRVYAAGLSAGGFMAMKVGCALSDRIAAIGVVGAAMPKKMICLPSRPVPVVMINGTSDPIVPHGGGKEHNLQLPVVSVEDTAKAFARDDRCAEKPTHSKLPARAKGGMTTEVDTYDGCHDGAQVVSYNVKGGGNTWPGGEQYQVEKQIGKTTQDINANEIIWNFMAAHRLPASSTNESGPSVK
jgi:polyhydroxybutyrate depolymerase